MKTLPQSILVFMFLSSFYLVQAQTIRGSGNVTKVDRNISSFHSVSVASGWDLILTQGNNEAMTVETDDNLHEVLETEVRGGTLHIQTKKGVNIRESDERKIYLSFKTMNTLNASGGSDVTAKGKINTGNFDLTMSGGSDLELANLTSSEITGSFSGGSDADIRMSGSGSLTLDCSGGSDLKLLGVSGDYCHLNLSGGSDADLSGSVGELNVNSSGGSDVDALDLEAKTAVIDLSGSSDGKFLVTQSLTISLSGGSDAVCKGDPDVVRQVVCKSCDISL